MKVSKQELEAVTALSPEKRYNYFGVMDIW